MTTQDARLFAEVAEALKQVQDRLRRLDADEATVAEVTRRFVAATNAAKHDLPTARRHLDALVADLDVRLEAQTGDPALD